LRVADWGHLRVNGAQSVCDADLDDPGEQRVIADQRQHRVDTGVGRHDQEDPKPNETTPLRNEEPFVLEDRSKLIGGTASLTPVAIAQMPMSKTMATAVTSGSPIVSSPRATTNGLVGPW
jgi:hypothetical protein